MGRSSESNFEADVGSTEGSHSIASDSLSDIAPGFMNEEKMVSVGSATDGDDVLEAAELNVESASLIGHNLAIVTHASHTLDSALQIALTSGTAGMPHSTSTCLTCVDR
jgi:hypothetical protein